MAEGPAPRTKLTVHPFFSRALVGSQERRYSHLFFFLYWKLAQRFSFLLRQDGLCPHLCVLSPCRVNWGKSAWMVLTVKM